MDRNYQEETPVATDEIATGANAIAAVPSNNSTDKGAPSTRFLALFSGYEHAYGTYEPKKAGDSGKVNGRAQTVKGELTTALIDGHLSGDGKGIGVVPLRADNTCYFGCIDVDIQGAVKLREDIAEIERRIRVFKMPLVVCRSKSGGAHLYLFCKEPAPAELVKGILERWAALLGYGGCEVFPKQISRANADDIGNWINLPYYRATATPRYALIQGRGVFLAEFLDHAESYRVTVEQLETLDVAEPASGELFADGPPCLQRLTAQGFPEGMRNDSLTSIAVYFRKKNPEGWKDDVIQFNSDNMNPPLPSDEVRTLIKSVGKKDYAYGCKKPPLSTVCDKQLCFTREFGIGGGAPDGIVISNRQLPEITEDAWDSLKKRNAEQPVLFQFGDKLSRVELDDRDNPTIKLMTPDILIYELGRSANWFRKTERGHQATLPPAPIAKDMLATPRDKVPLPVLRGITTAPIMAADGSVRVSAGYDPKTRVYFGKFEVPDVPETPTPEQVQQACALVLDDMLVDFPFEGASDRAHTLALFLLPFARELINGPTPLHLVGKPKAGTGASLMVEALTMPFLGRAPDMKAPPEKKDEWGKVILASLMEAPTFVVFDNLRNEVDSAALASALTSDTITDRILGISKLVCLPVRCVWVATGNNPTLSAEMTRRSVRIQINAKVERPQDRNEFRHSDLRSWVREQRAALIAAALTIVRAWIVAGRPEYNGLALGSYEAWSKVMGGILQNAGVPGFLEDRDRLYEGADRETETARLLVHAWINASYLNRRNVSTQELLNLVIARSIPVDVGGVNDTNKANVRLGIYLRGLVDQRFEFESRDGPLAVEFKKDQSRSGSNRWRLDIIEGQLPPSANLRNEDDEPAF